ncbi:DUF2220 family protein [Microbacterium sp. LRZ72]|uniref:Wadjet anti-phage system protein JetD domain-containing protein n=1 Tax=Microbacterium sp. LRZ72 TaxID=2942481 RepID=UPI0029ACD069|nr:Wadjet anti-phage system protein JetD domain-containing protein [Microbacterium sp. LRZ72]MDX2375216.1 DUF2220 family protein [Microbacterium sp. LRZ72]
MSDPASWTGVAGIAAAVRRRWDDGSLLRAWAGGEPFPTIEVPLRRPTAADLGEHFDAARAWADGVYRGGRDGRAYDVVRGAIGGRAAGRTELPARAIVSTFVQAWHLLGAAADADAYAALVAAASDDLPAREWALAHPSRAIAVAADWRTMLAAYRWLDANRGSGSYLRQVSAPGVDTKFIERHRGVLAAMLGVPGSAAGFAASLGLAGKPLSVRLRCDPVVLGLPEGLTEATLRRDELATLHVRPRIVLIIENEITYLSVAVPEGGLVIWGRGYDVDTVAGLPWLHGADVHYWGDLDTHGFAMLNRLRSSLPSVRSVLMDRETLLQHEDRWGHESAPTSVALDRLDEDESRLYADIVSDRYAPALRLEQERIDWAWVRERLPT